MVLRRGKGEVIINRPPPLGFVTLDSLQLLDSYDRLVHAVALCLPDSVASESLLLRRSLRFVFRTNSLHSS